jgi:hypothetical protein
MMILLANFSAGGRNVDMTESRGFGNRGSRSGRIVGDFHEKTGPCQAVFL